MHMLNERELQVYNAIKEHDDGRGVNHVICLMYGLMEEDEFNRIADSLVAKGKLKKFENAFGRTLYSVKDELEDKISGGRGNFFSSFERKFAAADKQTILNTAHDGMLDFIETSGMTNVKIILSLFLAVAKIGLCGKHKLSAPQKEMVQDILSDIFKYPGDMEGVYTELSKGYSENDFAMLEQFCNTALSLHATEPALHLLSVILSFAYIDGKLDDTVGARLESIYGMILIGNFFEQGETEDPINDEEKAAEERKRAEEEKARKLAEKRKAEEKRRAEELRKKEEEAARRAEEEKKQRIQQAHDAWEAECKAIEQRRSAELQKLLNEEKSALMAAAEINKQKCIDEANETIERENRRLHEAEATLASLGFFSFSQKKQQKSIIEDARNRITSAEKTKTEAQSNYKTVEDEISRKLNSKQADLQVRLKKEYPLPPEPERPHNASSGPKGVMTLQQQTMKIKDEIYACLLSGAATATEILNMIQHTYPDMTNQRTSAYLRQLILDGRVTKTTVNGKTYFSAEI